MRNTSYLFVFLMLSVLSSCGSSGNSSSGELCEYTEEKFNMKVISIKQNADDSTMFTIMVDFDGNIPFAEDVQNLMDVRDVTTDYDFVLRNGIKPGLIYKGTLHMLSNDASDCDEFIFDWDNKLK